MATGVALANPGNVIPVFSSDGSQMEGNTAEAARFAAAKNLNVKRFIDDNDVTIAGHPSEYLTTFDVDGKLRGHGIAVQEVFSKKLFRGVEERGGSGKKCTSAAPVVFREEVSRLCELSNPEGSQKNSL